MRRVSVLVLGMTVSALGPAPFALAASPAERPNIVLIMADDMGFSDLGCYGSEIATPNLDRLAAEGLRFSQFYNTARCCPTRACLLTGLYPHQAGVGHMVADRGTPAYQGYLNEHCVTIAEAIRRGGYRAMMVGKWHVGEKRPHWPLDRGFEKYFGLISGACNYFRLNGNRVMADDNTPYEPSGDFYMTDAFTQRAVEFLDACGGKKEPFFLYVAYTAPHWPLHARTEDIARYKGKYRSGWDALRETRRRKQIEMGLLDAKWPLTPRDPKAPAWADVRDKEACDLKMAVYAAQIDRLDQGVGRILTRIRQLGIEQNTLVMFLADNGACAEEVDRGTPGVPPGGPDSFMSYGLPWANASNTPFRLYKHWVHEGGISTPFIAYWPAVIRQRGTITHEVGHVVDLLATCLDVAGVEYPAEYNGHKITPTEGISLAPIFRTGTRKGHDVLYWEHEGNRAVRQGKWKLVSRFPDRWELYDIEADRTELNNVAQKHPEKVSELAGLYDAWAKRCGVMPWKGSGSAAGPAKKRNAK